MTQMMVQRLIDFLVDFATDNLIPLMAVTFVIGMLLRGLIYVTIKRSDNFAKEFEKRAAKFLDEEPTHTHLSFYVLSKKLLEKTFYELFEMRAIMKRRNPDYIMAMSDRVFLIKQGAAYLVRDTLKKVRFLKFKESKPKLLQLSNSVMQNNPCFTKIFGVIPGAPVNEVLQILPGMFIIAGIFGTFLGIMKALPDLGEMKLTDVEGTKMIMDQFLLKISFAMSTSIVGILFSVSMSFLNSVLNPKKLFVRVVERFEHTLDILWNRSDNNRVPDKLKEFDEHRDPIEALAEQAIEAELEKRRSRDKKSEDEKKAPPPTAPPPPKTDKAS